MMRRTRSPEQKGPPGWKLEPNSRWLYAIDGILWPIVLLDDDLVDEFEENKSSEKIRPAMQLGQHHFFWAVTDNLLNYDPTAGGFDLSRAAGRVDSALSLAHNEALNDDNDMSYWRGVLASENLARNLERDQVTPEKQPEVIDLGDESDDAEEIDTTEITPYTSNPDYATIVIGPKPKEEAIVVPRSYVDQNRHLRESVSYRYDENGDQIMVVERRAFQEHKPRIFKLIATWMRIGQFRPRIKERNRFEPALKTKKERLIEMEKIGQVFDLAREMLIFDIFEYLYHRYEALKPWPPQSILELVMLIWRRPHTSDEAEELLRTDLINTVARDYPDMVADDNGGVLHDLFIRYGDLAQAVFQKRYTAWTTENPDEMEDEIDIEG